MTVSSETNKASYTGDGTTTAFSTVFTFAANDEVLVTLVTDSTGAETTWAEGSQYTLTGAGTGSAGTVTAGTSPATGETLVVSLAPAFLQSSALPRGGTVSPKDTLEVMHDTRVRQILRLKDDVDRSLKFPIAESGSGEMPPAVERASLYLAFDENGLPVATSGVAFTADDSAPVSAAAGQIWYNTTNGRTYVYYADADSSQWVEIGGFYSTLAPADSSAVPHTPAGTGAVATTVKAALDQTIFVEDFGALGDGTTDDGPAINAALVAAKAAGVGRVQLAAKTYATNEAIQAQSGVSLKGVGPGPWATTTTIDDADFLATPFSRILALGTFPAGTPVVSLATPALSKYPLANCGLSDLWIDGDDVAVFGLRLVSAQRCTFTNVTVSRCTNINIDEDCLVPDLAANVAQAGGSTTTIVLAATSSSRDDLYNNMSIEITAGTSSGDTRTISDYDGATQTATVSVAFTADVSGGTRPTYTITGTGVTEGQNATLHNDWHNIISWCTDASTTVGWRQIGNTDNDINRSTYENIFITHAAGVGMLIANADTNVYTNVNTFAKATAYGIRLNGNAVNKTEFARALTFIQPQPGDGGTTTAGRGGFFIAKAGAAAGDSPRRIVIVGHSYENTSPAPIIQEGCSVVLMEDDVSGFVSSGWKRLLNWAGEGDTHTGDGLQTEFTNSAISIPGNLMNANGAIRVRYGVKAHENDASVKTFRVRYGTTFGGSVIVATADMANNVYLEGTVVIQNRDDTSKQFVTTETAGLTTTAPDELTQNTTVEQFIYLACQLGDTSDTMELEWAVVEVKHQR